MSESEKGMQIEALAADAKAQSVEGARELLREYRAFVQSISGPGVRLGRLDQEIAQLPQSYDAGSGEDLLIASVDKAAAGCVAYRALPEKAPERACELKRLWVREAFRKTGVGERLIQELLRRTADDGYEAVYLDTEPETMRAAYHLYLRLGFVECEPYRLATGAGVRFLRRKL